MKKSLFTAAFLLAACGSETDPPPLAPLPPSSPEPVSCDGRFEERLDDACRPVVVTDVVDEEVVVESGDLSLRGVITRPVAEGEFRPVTVVLIHGSGPQGVSGTVDGNLGVPYDQSVDSYARFAEQLAARGVATLRYEKRSCFTEAVLECSRSIDDYPGDVGAITVDDFVADARAAIRLVGDRDDLRQGDVIVAGHSQGGAYVPHLVASESAVTGGLGLGAPALPLVDSIAGQLDDLADFLEEEDATTYAADIDQLRAIAAQYRDELGQVLAGTWPEASWNGASTAFWSSWDAWSLRSLEDLAEVDEPLLYLSCDFDFNVAPRHLDAFAERFDALGLDATATLLSGCTHSFVPIFAGRPPLEVQVEPSFEPAAIDAIVDWLRASGG